MKQKTLGRINREQQRKAASLYHRMSKKTSRIDRAVSQAGFSLREIAQDELVNPAMKTSGVITARGKEKQQRYSTPPRGW